MDRNPLLSLQLFCKSKIIPKQRERTSRPERSCALQQRAVPAPHVVCSWTRQPWVPVSELRFHSIHSALGVGRTAPLGVTNSLPGLELKPSDPGDQGAFLGCSHADPQGGPMPTESWGRTHHVLHLRNAREALPDLHTAPRSQAWAPSRPPLPASLSCQLLKASIRLPASLELGGLGHPLRSPHSARAAESQLSIPLLPSPASAPASCPPVQQAPPPRTAVLSPCSVPAQLEVLQARGWRRALPWQNRSLPLEGFLPALGRLPTRLKDYHPLQITSVPASGPLGSLFLGPVCPSPTYQANSLQTYQLQAHA